MYQAMASSKEFSSSYMVLKPEKVSLFGLLHIVFSSHIDKMKFVELPEETEVNLQEHRWIIFISVLVQMILQFVAKPLSWFGSVFEWWLNLLSCNQNFIWLLLNFIRGRVVKPPERTSATFLSTIGNLDTRVELDKSITHGDSRYYPALSALASKISYENEAFVRTTVTDRWKMELVGYYNFWNDFQGKFTTQAFILHDKTADMIVVAFRGTETFEARDWCTDLDISWIELSQVGRIHGGFMKALGLVRKQGWPKEIFKEDHDHPLAYYTIREKLRKMLHKNNKTKFIVTGHSLGGALAILFPTVLVLHEEDCLLKRLEGIYTFGQPRVGNGDFGRFMTMHLQKYGVKYLRFVYGNDVVPRLPTEDKTLLFKHFGTCLYYNSFYNGKILPEEPYKNYFSLLAWIPKHLNAVWELLRSFIIPFTKGPEYAESFLLIMIRVFGLIFPGLAAHGPQDYINATRLGSPALYLQL